MGTPIINGSIAAIVKPVEIDYDPVRGINYTQEFHSAGDNLGGLANSLILAGCAFHWVKSPVLSTITARWSGGQGSVSDVPAASWQLLGNEIQKSIYESGIALSGLQTYPSLTADVKNAFAAIESGDQAAADDIRDSLPDGELVYFDPLISFLTRGQTHFAAGQYVLKRTISVSNFYTGVLPGEGDVEGLLTTSEVLTLGMPPLMANKIASIPIPGSHDNYLWSWRQLPSQMVTAANNRSEVSTEWWLEEWSTQLYSVV